jgi:SAM-dependent methyltransferase
VTLPATFALGSRSRLTPRAAALFPEPTLLHRVARALCAASCLPRKELFESWEVARRVRRKFRGGRVVDMACGHGLLAYLMLLLDDTSPTALAVDVRIPPSAAKVRQAMEAEWPRLSGRVLVRQGPLADVELARGDVVVSAHACGALTDEVLARAIAASARVAVLPCCQDEALGDDGGVGGWLDAPLAIDVTRAARLRAAGYAVHTQTIPVAITQKNRLLLGEPSR